MSHPPSLSEAESGLKHKMILNEIQQYDSQFDAVARMHKNVFTQVQSSGLTEIHVRAGALEAHRLRFNHSSNSTSCSVQTSYSFHFHICKIRILIPVSESDQNLVNQMFTTVPSLWQVLKILWLSIKASIHLLLFLKMG